MVAKPLVRHHTPVTTVDELWYFVEASQSSVPVHAIQSLFDSMPKRIKAVISVRGGPAPFDPRTSTGQWTGVADHYSKATRRPSNFQENKGENTAA
ncbi:hypothetical protein TNCV_3875631 [Trichonephila clavipes]|uniref:Uncharacterized protein n=1 Tax=Trichonephila clavipes TaxID=2585209 RepID=A0A8X6VS03_TRICX|nr:hypothetical protein TNCV_3875631 [Trichonephila clavipes]